MTRSGALLVSCLALLLACLCAFPVWAEDAAPSQPIVMRPFGLTPGMTEQEVRASGVVLKQESKDGMFTTYKATNLPKAVSLFVDYELTFAEEFGLAKIEAFGRPIVEDPYGDRGVNDMTMITNLLSKKYGESKRDWTIHECAGTKKTGFYTCFKDGHAISSWNTVDNTSLELQLHAAEKDTGQISLTYYLPTLHQATTSVKEKSKARALDIL